MKHDISHRAAIALLCATTTVIITCQVLDPTTLR
ncbi:hypothetical protein FBY37_6237 [Streptomyces sp. SLBN-134]|nr:hypothetical protein FBY37_6237 [Streptomyces sp. SLBN-134]